MDEADVGQSEGSIVSLAFMMSACFAVGIVAGISIGIALEKTTPSARACSPS